MSTSLPHWYASKNATICKICAHLFDKNRAALLWFVREVPGYGIAALFAKFDSIFANVPQFGETHRIFVAKGAAILELRRFTRRHTAARPSKCGQTCHNSAKRTASSWQKVPQSLSCGALQDGTLRHGHQSAAKRATFGETHRIFAAKGAAILELRRFTRRHTAARPSKCGQTCHNSAKRTAFSWQKALQSLSCSALQDGTLRHGHQSAAKRATIRRNAPHFHGKRCCNP